MTRKTRDILEETALRLFAERGLSEVSIRDIAEAMGVQQSTLYRHMTSKEALVTRIFSRAYLHLTQELEAAMADQPDIEARLAALVHAAYAAYDAQPDLIRFLLMRQHEVLPRLEQGARTPLHVVQDLCADGVGRGAFDPLFTRDQAAAILSGLILQPMIFTHYGTLQAPAISQVGMVLQAARAALFKR